MIDDGVFYCDPHGVYQCPLCCGTVQSIRDDLNLLDAATRFQFGFNLADLGTTAINVEWRSSLDPNNQDRWAVERLGKVYDKTAGEWVYEPSPSNRSNDFLRHTRYTRDEAIKIAIELTTTA